MAHLFTRMAFGENPQPMLYRTLNLNTPGKIVFNPNNVVKDGIDIVDAVSFSPDGKKLGYQMTKNETDYAIIGFIDLETLKNIDFILQYSIRSLEDNAFAWASDGTGVIFTRFKKPPNLSFTDAGRNNDLFPYSLERVFHYWGVHPDFDIVCVSEDNMLVNQENERDLCEEKTSVNLGQLRGFSKKNTKNIFLKKIDDNEKEYILEYNISSKSREINLFHPLFETLRGIDEKDSFDSRYIGRDNIEGISYYSTSAGAPRYHIIGVNDETL
ncbi:hypothetical protein HK096_003236, partial [Nowakowskiella sp. JEL0078]